MSDSTTVSIIKPSPRGFARALVFGTLVAMTAWMTQNPATHFKGHTSGVPMLRLIDATDVQPSAYDEESAMSSKQLLNRWDAVITEASQRFHVPKAWIRAVMAHESGGRTMLGEDRPIVSRAGAIGLMQVLPSTYDEMAEQHKLGANPFDARDNIMAGTAYLRWLHKRYGFPKMFAAYNAGPGRVAQGGRLPAETRRYVGGITRSLKAGAHDGDLVKLTRPDGAAVKIDVAKVVAVRPAQPGEYAHSVKTVLILGKHKRQAVREDVHVATAAIRSVGGLI